MADTRIEWTDRVWNPTTGCDRVSPGCAHCYALTLAKRLKAMGQPRYQKDGGRASGPGFGLTMHPDTLELPLSWRKPSRVFVNSMSDLFHEEVTFDFIDRVFAVMALTPQHTYQILTKRPERMRQYLTQEELVYVRWETAASTIINDWPGLLEFPLPNVWLGVSVENQRWADERIPILLDTPAAVRFLSCEPLLGPVDLDPFVYGGSFKEICPTCDGKVKIPGSRNWVAQGYTEADCFRCTDGRITITVPAVNWVIVGGESGPKHRPMNPEWARSIVAQCRDAGVACFVKQLGGARPGTKLEDLPADLQVREWPAARP